MGFREEAPHAHCNFKSIRAFSFLSLSHSSSKLDTHPPSEGAANGSAQILAATLLLSCQLSLFQSLLERVQGYRELVQEYTRGLERRRKKKVSRSDAKIQSRVLSTSRQWIPAELQQDCRSSRETPQTLRQVPRSLLRALLPPRSRGFSELTRTLSAEHHLPAARLAHAQDRLRRSFYPRGLELV